MHLCFENFSWAIHHGQYVDPSLPIPGTSNCKAFTFLSNNDTSLSVPHSNQTETAGWLARWDKVKQTLKGLPGIFQNLIHKYCHMFWPADVLVYFTFISKNQIRFLLLFILILNLICKYKSRHDTFRVDLIFSWQTKNETEKNFKHVWGSIKLNIYQRDFYIRHLNNRHECQCYFRLRLRIFVIVLDCLPRIQTYVERNKIDNLKSQCQ